MWNYWGLALRSVIYGLYRHRFITEHVQGKETVKMSEKDGSMERRRAR